LWSFTIYFLTHQEFFGAALYAWCAGAFDILDGKIARKYNLSTQFGVQLDSFADFLSFVIVPTMFIYFGIIDGKEIHFLNTAFVAFAFIYYVISGLRRLIQFNIEADAGSVGKYFTGVPTPLGAILLWLVYLANTYEFLPAMGVLIFMVVIGWSLNSKLKVRHP